MHRVGQSDEMGDFWKGQNQEPKDISTIPKNQKERKLRKSSVLNSMFIEGRSAGNKNRKEQKEAFKSH